MKKLMSLCLALLMVLTLVPATVLAGETMTAEEFITTYGIGYTEWGEGVQDGGPYFFIGTEKVTESTRHDLAETENGAAAIAAVVDAWLHKLNERSREAVISAAPQIDWLIYFCLWDATEIPAATPTGVQTLLDTYFDAYTDGVPDDRPGYILKDSTDVAALRDDWWNLATEEQAYLTNCCWGHYVGNADHMNFAPYLRNVFEEYDHSQQQEGGDVSAADAFVNDDHAYTYDGETRYYHLRWDGTDECTGEWHLYESATRQENSWTDCGAAAIGSFASIGENEPVRRAAFSALVDDYLKLSDSERADLREWHWWVYCLVQVYQLELTEYTSDDKAAADAFIDQYIDEFDGETYGLTLADNIGIGDLEEAYEALSLPVRAALQKEYFASVQGNESSFTVNFTQAYFRTLETGGGGSESECGDSVIRYNLEADDDWVYTRFIVEEIRPDLERNLAQIAPDWREWCMDVKHIGLPESQLAEVAQTGNVELEFILPGFTLTMPAAVVTAYSQQLQDDPARDILWVSLQQSMEKGQANMVEFSVWCEGPEAEPVSLELPEDSAYAICLRGRASQEESFTLYVPNEENTALSATTIPVRYETITTTYTDIDDREQTDTFGEYRFSVDHAGTYVAAPTGYTPASWPWAAQEGADDCITSYRLENEDKDFIVEEIFLSEGDESVLIAPARRRDCWQVARVFLPKTVLQQIAGAEKSLQLHVPDDLTITLSEKTVQAAADLADGLWVSVDYSGWEENQRAVQFSLWQDAAQTETFTLPEGESYGVSLAIGGTEAPEYVLYCPDENNDKLIQQKNEVDCVIHEEQEYSTIEFAADYLAMFVVAPKGQEVDPQWPWSGAGYVNWTPEGFTPENATDNMKALYEDGFTCPRVGTDFNISFPEQLVDKADNAEDYDYSYSQDESTGVLTIEVDPENYQHWKEAVLAQDAWYSDGVYFNVWFGPRNDWKTCYEYGVDIYSCPEGMEETEEYDLTELNLREDYCVCNSMPMVSVNQVGNWATVSTDGKEVVWTLQLCLSHEACTAAEAPVKLAIEMHIKPTASSNFSMQVDNAAEDMPAERIEAETVDGWNVWAEEGRIRVYPGADINLDDYICEEVATLKPVAPEGYELAYRSSVWSTDTDISHPITYRGSGSTEYVTYVWKSLSDGSELREQVRIDVTYARLWQQYLPTVTTLAAQDVITAQQRQKLEENGIEFTYDEENGYFVVNVADPMRVQDISVLEEGITLQSPYENATQYRMLTPGGSEHPAQDNETMAPYYAELLPQVPVQQIADGLPQIPFIEANKTTISDITVYFAAAQFYRSVVVQWLDEGGSVLGYSYVCGHNNDFARVVTSESAASVNAPVDMPTLVSEETMNLVCNIYPQSRGEGNKRYFEFSVDDPDRMDKNDGNDIYLPYAYFDMTAQQGLARKAAGLRPFIYHYGEDGELRAGGEGRHYGEYTAYGVKFTTKSFSPFVVAEGLKGDMNNVKAGETSVRGDGVLNVLDMQALYDHLSGETPLDETFAAAVADVNSDEAVDILDYQALYETVKAQQ